MRKSIAAIFVMALAITANAATAEALASTITDYGLEAAADGNAVAVTGTLTDATATLTLDIDADVTVNWQAELVGSNTTSLVIKSGTGNFKVQSGKIENTGEGGSIIVREGDIAIIGIAKLSAVTYGEMNVSDGVVTLNATTNNFAKKDSVSAKLLNEVSAKYPPRAKKMGISGYAKIYMLIDKNGDVAEAFAIEVEPKGFDFETEALAAVRQYKFSPALVDNEPVNDRLVRKFHFIPPKIGHQPKPAGKPSAPPLQIAASSIRTQATANAIVLENLPKNAKVEVYSMQGKRIYFSNSENSKILKIQVQTKGIYLVKAANQTSRVAVR
jgi:TonB family protein